MDRDERARLRALCEGVAMPLNRAQTDSSAIEISDAEGVYVGSVDLDYGLGIDGSESTEAHAALIVSAVNALPSALDALDAADRAAELAEGTIAALRDRLGEMEAIIAGRTTPPTDAEIEAHAATGGLWRFLGLRGFALSADCVPAEDAIIPRALGLRTGITRRWWPLDAEGRPCAWPTAKGSE